MMILTSLDMTERVRRAMAGVCVRAGREGREEGREDREGKGDDGGLRTRTVFNPKREGMESECIIK